MKQPLQSLDQHFSLPAVRRVSLGRLWVWLAAGWQDLAANPLPSLAYGLLFGIGGDLILLASLQHPHLFTAAVSGFFLLAPILAAGLYELSRRRCLGQQPGFIDSLAGLGRQAEALAQFGLILALLALVWERVSAIMFAMLGAGSGIDTTHFLTQVLLGGEHRGFVAAWFIAGATLALLTFAISVVSVPLLLDRDADAITAVMTSLRTFAVNLDVLVLWAATIVVLTLFGFASLLFGLVIVMPLLGHASWHAYRDLVE